MERILLLVLVVCCSLVSKTKGQDSTNTSGLEKNMFKLNVISPGFGYERHVVGPTTININPAMGTNFAFYASSFGSQVYFSLQPYIEFQYRVYYNLKIREQSGRSVKGNSANYFAFSYTGYLPQLAGTNTYLVNGGTVYGVRIGMQRTTGRLVYRLDYGIGVYNDVGGAYLLPASSYSLGYVLGAGKN